MSLTKLYGGSALRRLRKAQQLSQTAMAERLDISPSYLNLLESNQRPISARLMVQLTDKFNFDPLQLLADTPGGGVEAMMRRLSDPMFDDLSVDRAEIEEWLAMAPGSANAFARLYDNRDTISGTGHEEHQPIPTQLARQEIERWNNYFGDLDEVAEALADELRLSSADLYTAITQRLRDKHQLMIRILPANILPDKLRRLDLHARQLQLSEMLDPASRTFQAAYLLAQLEQRDNVRALASAGDFDDRAAERLLQRHLYSYFAAALMMPYARFLRACEQTGYDIRTIQRRFGAGFEQVAHRLTTLQRVGQRGLSFFMVRLDRAGQFSKRYSGASGAALVDSQGTCPLWTAHKCFETQGALQFQWVEWEDGQRWFTIARAVEGSALGASDIEAQFAIALGVAENQAKHLNYSMMAGPPEQAQKIGAGCLNCRRSLCTQRAVPPSGQVLRFDERERGLAPFEF